MKRPSSQTRVVLHNHPQQPHGCLRGLANYAEAISRTPVAQSFRTLEDYERWSMRQPVKIDLGEGPAAPGCVPAQRSRLWPQDGLNCWETTAHYVGVAVAQGIPVEVHVYDRDFGPVRHVYPAVRSLGDKRPPIPVLLQPSLPRPRAQEWWNDALGAVHIGGSVALSAFGLGVLPPVLERIEGDALPSWARMSPPAAQPGQPMQPGPVYRDLAPGAAVESPPELSGAWPPPQLWMPA